MGDCTPEFARKLFGELGKRLADEVSLYDCEFAILFEREQDVREQYARATAGHILRDAAPASPQEKGRSLEDLMRVIFSARPGLEASSTRYGAAPIEYAEGDTNDRVVRASDRPGFLVAPSTWPVVPGIL